jgi:hypothetical protein
LWTNGRIDAGGGAPPVTDLGEASDWYSRFDPPGVAIYITNWSTGAGWVLDYRGGFNAINGATHTNVSNTVMAGIPISADPHSKLYVDWAWDPAGNGQGYVLDAYGRIRAFGGATAPPRTTARWGSQQARKFQMRFSPSKLAITADRYGKLWGDFGATVGAVASTWGNPTTDKLRDFTVMDWTTGSGYLMAADGSMHVFGTRTRPFGWPSKVGGDLARTLSVISSSNPESFREVWAGGQVYEFVSSTPPTVIAGAGQSEVQTVTITGTPTGGTFTLTYSGQTTGTIAFNATATTVQTALRALSNIGSTGVNVTGGPGPGTPWAVAFAGALADTDVALMTATSSLTGGTSPTVSVATTTEGLTASPANTVTDTTRPDLRWDYSDPQGDEQTEAELLVFTQAFVDAHSMTDPLSWLPNAVVALETFDRTARGFACPVDLTNTSYRMYVHARDTANQWSAWANRGWTQNVAAPPNPDQLHGDGQSERRHRDAVGVDHVRHGDTVKFERSTDGGTTWSLGARSGGGAAHESDDGHRLRAADRVAPALYRARTYSTNPRVLSAASNTASATITKQTEVLTAVADPTLGGEVYAVDAADWTRPVSVGIFQAIGTDYPTVLKDGRPKARRTTLRLHTQDRASWNKVQALIESESTLVYRDSFGEVIYCELASDWSRGQLPAAPLPSETTPLRHYHTTDLPLVEVESPILAV